MGKLSSQPWNIWVPYSQTATHICSHIEVVETSLWGVIFCTSSSRQGESTLFRLWQESILIFAQKTQKWMFFITVTVHRPATYVSLGNYNPSCTTLYRYPLTIHNPNPEPSSKSMTAHILQVWVVWSTIHTCLLLDHNLTMIHKYHNH